MSFVCQSISLHEKPSVIALFGGLFALSGHAAPGDLDRSFAPGIVVTQLGEMGDVTAAGVSPDGRVDVAGPLVDWHPSSVTARYLADGTPDYAAGERGYFPFSFYGQTVAVCSQPDGKLVLVQKGAPLVLSRWNPDGIPDGSFAFTALSAEFFWDSINGPMLLRRTAEGKFVLAGRSLYTGEAMVQRFLPDGTPDGSFAAGDVARLPIQAAALAVQPDGKVLLAGRRWEQSSLQNNFAVARLSADGTMDAAFGVNGVVEVDLAYDDAFVGLTVLADGKILTTGQANGSQVVVR